VKITYSRRLMDHYKREAKRLFPLEAFAVLLGFIDGDSINIAGLFIPENQELRSTHQGISAKNCNMWFARGDLVGKKFGLDCLGEIHSHPWASTYSDDRSPSDTDWDRVGQLGTKIHAICSIRRYPTGRTISRIKVWPALPSLREKVTP